MRVGIFAALAGGLVVPGAACGRWADQLTCPAAGCDVTAGEWQRLASLADRPGGGAPGLPPLPPDPSNRWADDPAAASLGQRFFFDPAFSGPSRQMDSLRRPTSMGRTAIGQPSGVSCATCHDLAQGGADVSSMPGHVSVGAGVTDVNALSVLNAARRPSLFWNGRMPSLWGLNALVAESDTTMNGNRLATAHLLLERYADAMDATFGRFMPENWRTRVPELPPRGKPGRKRECRAGDPSEPYGDVFDCLTQDRRDLATALLVLWAKALAAYGRRLESRDSAFDRFIVDGPDSGHLSASARRGASLFVGKASCIDCHSGPLLTDEGFHNVGVPQTGASVPTVADCVVEACDCVAGNNCFPWGRLAGIAWQNDPDLYWLQLVADYRDDREAPPPAAPVAEERWKGAWRTPSLRDVALTAPYMHDGAYRTLEEVLWHYNTGGRTVTAPTIGVPSVRLEPLGLQLEEMADLIAFLRSLTGSPVPEPLRRPGGPP